MGEKLKIKEVFLNIGASWQRLLKGAEEICLRKQCKDKNVLVTEFLYQDIENFLNEGYFFKLTVIILFLRLD